LTDPNGSGLKRKQKNGKKLVMAKKKKKTKEYWARKYGYKSGLEKVTADFLKEHKVPVEYEKTKITYTIPARKTFYKPDFKLPNGIFVETKGRFTAQDRKKHLLIREQYPNLDIRFIFSNPNTKIRKGSKTSYANWCDKNGFQYAKAEIPIEWIEGD